MNILFLASTVLALYKAGPFNEFYQVPYSEGSRVAEIDSKEVILNDDPSLFFWSYNFNVDNRLNLWVADMDLHSVYYISKEEETWNAIFKVAGIDGQQGMRNGNIAKATFNSPSSLAPFSIGNLTS